MPRSLPLALLVLAATAGCSGEEDLDTDLQIPRDYAKIRVLALVDGAADVDAFVTNGRLPPTAMGLVASPGLAPFHDAHVGDVKAFVAKDGGTLGRLETKIEKGAAYTLVATGDLKGATVALAKEAFEPAADKARVRFVNGLPSPAVANVVLAGVTLAAGAERGALGTWTDVPAGTPLLEARSPSGLIARFTLPELKAGDLRTLVLVPGTTFSPTQLLVVSERADGAFATTRLDQDGTNKPKAKLRLVHAAANVGLVEAEAGVAVAANLDRKGVGPTVDVAIDAKLVVKSGTSEVATLDLALEEGKAYTAALVGNGAPGSVGVKVVLWPTEIAAGTAPSARLANAVAGMPGTLELAKADETPVLPKTAYGAASAYGAAEAGPSEGVAILEITFGGQTRRQPVATFSGLTFPADHPATALALGSFSAGNPQAQPPVPPSFEAALVVIDDVTGAVFSEATLTPAQQPQP